MLRKPSQKGLVVVDARHVPATGETRIIVSVCRMQPLCVEGVDPEGAYRVQVDDEPARYFAPRVVRTIEAQLSNSKRLSSAVVASSGVRAKIAGTTTFLDLLVQGDEDNHVERTVRITKLPDALARHALERMRAATPEKTGRVQPTMASVPADE